MLHEFPTLFLQSSLTEELKYPALISVLYKVWETKEAGTNIPFP